MPYRYKNVYKIEGLPTIMKAKKKASLIQIYTTKDCPWCKKTKEFLHANNIRFTSYDVESNSRAAQTMVKKSGQSAVPVIEIGKTIIVGFDEPALRNALGMKKKRWLPW